MVHGLSGAPESTAPLKPDLKFFRSEHPSVMTLYDYLDSGNGYKIRLLLAQLKRLYRYVELDIMRGETHTPLFLAKNPNGRIPTLELEDGRCLAESDAILWYLADGTGFVPSDSYARAQVLQWMFFEQYSHEPYIAVARFWLAFVPEEKRREKILLLPEWHARGNAALDVMEGHLKTRDWFVANKFTLADIALYAYTHCAADGGFNLSKYPRVQGWLKRIENVKGYVPMPPAPLSGNSKS